MLQCEIDLSCCNIGNPYIPTDQIATRNFIWLSLRYRDENDLGEGFFICSEKRNKLRLPMSFSGTVTENGTETKIRSGKVVVNKDQAEVRLSFELRLENNRRISGRYSGPFARNIIHN